MRRTVSLVFSKIWYGARNLYEVVSDRAVMQQFLVRLMSYSFTFKCHWSTSVILLDIKATIKNLRFVTGAWKRPHRACHQMPKLDLS